MSQTQLPILAVTLGDPAGIGPEIVAASLADASAHKRARGLAVGDLAALERAIEVQKLPVKAVAVKSVEEAKFLPGTIEILDLGMTTKQLQMGLVSAEAGASAIAAIETATKLAMDGVVSGIVTAPINKEAIWAAGSKHLGHTEMLGELTGSKSSDTMFVVQGLKLFFTTRHVPLRTALDQLNIERVVVAIKKASLALKTFGEGQNRLAVAAVNPHGGENGNFGREEIDILKPAIEICRSLGIDVVGPIPADSVFHHGLTGRYDGILTHFHDQGHIPSKTFDFDGTVSVTIGLPILRTSVDHGTAFDIAGKAIASSGTMSAAFEVGAAYSQYAGKIRDSFAGFSTLIN
jgi:4-hydroxythreonine-4-phosphate dehydrogenase